MNLSRGTSKRGAVVVAVAIASEIEGTEEKN